MLLNTNQGFYLDREFVADSFFEASQLSELFWKNPTISGIEPVFHTLGITHVLVHVPNKVGREISPSTGSIPHRPTPCDASVQVDEWRVSGSGSSALETRGPEALTTVIVANTKFNRSGIDSLMPKIRKQSARSAVQAIDEEEDVNPSELTPQTPCRAKFFAIAMWMYGSSSA